MPLAMGGMGKKTFAKKAYNDLKFILRPWYFMSNDQPPPTPLFCQIPTK